MTTDDLSVLDNPLWHSLTTIHKQYCTGEGKIRVVLPEIFPYFAIENPAAEDQLGRIIPWLKAGDHLSLLGAIPARIPEALKLDYKYEIFQMIADRNELLPESLDAAIERIEDSDEVLAIKTDVDPHYYQPDTFKLGRFFGIRDHNKLVAVAGERIKLPGFTEISSVCTYPEYRGRGYATQLITHLHNLNLKEGYIPFLHLTKDNPSIRLYEKLGFRMRSSPSICSFSLEAT
ncbi:GNAT family N-acetyltransferase [Pedobacter westerhofensis]|nr:GNAT family N-acetyltransferase [Pedobacter westerhofensis]